MESSSGILLAGAVPEPRKRRRIPTWLRVSAAAALGLVVLLILGGVWLVGYVKRMSDPHVQWAAIREVIAVDEPPPTYRMFGVPRFNGLQSWVMSHGTGVSGAVLMSDQGARIRLPESWQEMPKLMAGGRMGERLDSTVPLESGEIVVQGRELRCMRFGVLGRKDSSDEQGSSSPEVRSFPAIMVDLSQADEEESLAFIVFAEEGDRVEDAQVVEFLKPFHVGPDR